MRSAASQEKQTWISKTRRLAKQSATTQDEFDRKLSHGGEFLQKFGVELAAQRVEEDGRRARSSEWLDVSLEELYAIVVDFRRAVAKGPGEGPAGERHVERLRLLMETAESRIHSVKSVQAARFDECLDEEGALSRELAALSDSFETRFTNDANDPAFAARAKPIGGGSAARRTARGGVPRVASIAARRQRSSKSGEASDAEGEGWEAEVKRIDREISADGGQYGRWTKGEQELFLSLATRFNVGGDGADAAEHAEHFLQLCDVQIPTQSPGAIRKHWAWWVQYNARAKRKRELVAAWKGRRAAKQRSAAKAAEKVGRKQERDSAAAEQRSAAAVERRRRREKASLEAWRETRQEQRAAEEAALVSSEERETQRKAQRKADEKQRVAIYRLQKLQEDSERRRMQSMLSAAAKPPAAINSVQAERIKGLRAAEMERARVARERRRDETKRRLDEQRVAPAARSVSTVHSSKVAAKVKRDPTRLLKPTASFRKGALSKKEREARARAMRDGGGSAHDSIVPSASGATTSGRPIFYGIGMASASGRAVPSWRGRG